MKLIEGFGCEGRLVTCTIPATLIANTDQPIRVEVEEWIATELRLLLRHVQRVSLGSEHIRHLSNIRRVEPDAGLFRVPEEYGLIESGVATGLGIEWRFVKYVSALFSSEQRDSCGLMVVSARRLVQNESWA